MEWRITIPVYLPNQIKKKLPQVVVYICIYFQYKLYIHVQNRQLKYKIWA